MDAIGSNSRFTPVRFDRRALDINQLAAVTTHLERKCVYYEEHGAILLVPQGHADGVQGVIDRHAPRLSSYSDVMTSGAMRAWRPRYERAFDRDEVEVVIVAAVWRRPIRWVVDMLATAAMYAALLAGLESSVSERVAMAIAWSATSLLVMIAPTALWGRTPGGFVTSTVVLDDDHLERPGWIRSIVRWVVPQVPGVVTVGLVDLGVGRWVLWLWVVGVVIVFGWILVNRDRRGVHDLWSHTMVFDSRPVRRRRSDLDAGTD